MSTIERQAKRVSNKLTKWIGCRAGEQTKCLWVMEYPKSGGTWFGKMVADALQMPYPAPAVFPVTFPAVVHSHWKYDPRLRRVFYLVRDGRDVMVSFYFHRMRRLQAGNPAAVAMFKRPYDRLFGPGYDPDDIRRHLPKFIEHEFARPRSARINWRDHVRSWRGDQPGGRPHVTYLSYEELLADGVATLTRVIESATGRALEPWRAEMTVEKFSFARQTGGRAQGQEDRGSFIRKGVAGDWRNHFTREAAEVFESLAGDVLRDLGYEADATWVESANATA